MPINIFLRVLFFRSRELRNYQMTFFKACDGDLSRRTAIWESFNLSQNRAVHKDAQMAQGLLGLNKNNCKVHVERSIT